MNPWEEYGRQEMKPEQAHLYPVPVAGLHGLVAHQLQQGTCKEEGLQQTGHWLSQISLKSSIVFLRAWKAGHSFSALGSFRHLTIGSCQAASLSSYQLSSCQPVKLPACLLVKLPVCQATSCQAVKLPACQATSCQAVKLPASLLVTD